MATQWRLAAVVAVVAATVPAAALGAGHGLAVLPWMPRMMGQAPPETQQMMQTPQLRQMMANPPPGMETMMNAPGMQEAMKHAPQGMEQMMQSAGMQLLNGGGSGH